MTNILRVIDCRKPAPPSHTCHWPGCTIEIPEADWGCSRHWEMVPAYYRNLLNAFYRRGQEKTKTPSGDYLDAAVKLHQWCRFKNTAVKGNPLDPA